MDQDHVWHMDTLAEVCRHEPRLLLATPYKVVDVTDPASQDEGTDWWLELTGRGGEGMVVKPLSFITKGKRGLAQPAVKCRGREYLRIIYGPEYTAPEHLDRLRQPRPGHQAVAGPPGVRPGRRGPGTLRPARTAPPRPRVRLRRAGDGKRAGRSPAVIASWSSSFLVRPAERRQTISSGSGVRVPPGALSFQAYGSLPR